MPAVALEYVIVPGDSWIGVSNRLGVTLADLLSVNASTTSTPLFVGRRLKIPMPPSCVSCRHWSRIRETPDGDYGDCHRFPPRIMEVLVDRYLTAHPTTRWNDWCGEWSRA